MQALLFSSLGALFFDTIMVASIVVLYRKYARKITIVSAPLMKAMTVALCFVFASLIWKTLVSSNSGAQKTMVDTRLISELTEEKLERNLTLLFQHEWIENFNETESINNNSKTYSAYYRRRNEIGEYTSSFMSISVRVYTTAEYSADSVRLSSLKYDCFRSGDNEAYLGRAVYARNADTFYLTSSHRYFSTHIRVGKYIIDLHENTQTNLLNDLRTNDILRILNDY